jgi:hypothetical protein
MLADHHKVALGRLIVRDVTILQPVFLLIVHYILNKLLLVQIMTPGCPSRERLILHGAWRWALLSKIGL